MAATSATTWAATSTAMRTSAATSHGHHAGDAHADADQQHPDSTHLFGVVSFRTLVAAAAFFGVTGKAALERRLRASRRRSFWRSLVGVFAMYGMYWLMRLIAGLNSSGNERIGNAVGPAGHGVHSDPGRPARGRQSAAFDAEPHRRISSGHR